MIYKASALAKMFAKIAEENNDPRIVVDFWREDTVKEAIVSLRNGEDLDNSDMDMVEELWDSPVLVLERIEENLMNGGTIPSIDGLDELIIQMTEAV